MKSLILKDLYNIGSNVKSLLIAFTVLAVSLIPSSNLAGFTVMCAVVCCMMVVTTFSFDEASGWTRYAMIMPLTKRDLVAGKFAVLAILCAIGSLFRLMVGSIVGLAAGKLAFDTMGITEQVLGAIIALAASFVIGSTSVPLVLRFGTEKARLLLIASVMIPFAVCFGIYRLLGLILIDLNDQLLFVLVCCSPIPALLWCYMMYRIGCRIFEKQEV